MFLLSVLKAVGKFLTSPLGLLLLGVALLVGSHTWTYQSGKSAERAEGVSKEKARARWVEAATKEAKSASDLVVHDLRLRLAASEERKNKVETIIKKVNVYVTEKADSQCVLTRGFEWVHDAPLTPTASGVADSPPGNVAEASPLKVSELAAIVASNNAEAVQRGEIIEMWQDWYLKNKKIFEQYQKDATKVE